jgi:peptide methionine sulfoxide reductase msrA/msrB
LNRAPRSALLALLIAIGLVVFPLAGCTSADDAESDEEQTSNGTDSNETEPATTVGGEDVSTIYLAGGCFWGVEKYMAEVEGVVATEVGYANGETDSPTYRDVVTGDTGYTETVRVDYDPEVAPLPFLLELFYSAIDPTSVNRQGNDVGTQYRTGIYYEDPEDERIVERSLGELQEEYDDPIAVEQGPLTAYTTAEEYHQDYLEKNPGGYCHIGGELFENAAEAEPKPEHFGW